MTQTEKVLAYLKDGKSITPLKAQAEFGIWRLAHCIYVLRNQGYKIITSNKRGVSGGKYAEYKLMDEDRTLKVGMDVWCSEYGDGLVIDEVQGDFVVAFDSNEFFYHPEGTWVGDENNSSKTLMVIE